MRCEGEWLLNYDDHGPVGLCDTCDYEGPSIGEHESVIITDDAEPIRPPTSCPIPVVWSVSNVKATVSYPYYTPNDSDHSDDDVSFNTPEPLRSIRLCVICEAVTVKTYEIRNEHADGRVERWRSISLCGGEECAWKFVESQQPLPEPLRSKNQNRTFTTTEFPVK